MPSPLAIASHIYIYLTASQSLCHTAEEKGKHTSVSHLPLTNLENVLQIK